MVGGRMTPVSPRISSHVLDTNLGRPAAGILVVLEFAGLGGHWETLGDAYTDADGRCGNLLPEHTAATIKPGQYRLRFETGSYHAAQSIHGLYQTVEVQVTIRAGDTHLHVPLLLSPNGYTTYRGS